MSRVPSPASSRSAASSRTGAARVLATVGLALFAGSCGGGVDKGNQNFTVLEPEMLVNPDTIEFGGVVKLYDAEETFQILNTGRSDLVIDEIAFGSGGDAEVFGLSPSSGTVEAGDSLEVTVSFAPDGFVSYARNIKIVSNDPTFPEFYVPVTGEGVDGPVPDIDLPKKSLDFGLVNVGDDDNLVLEIENKGGGELVLDSVAIEGSGAFTIASAGETTIGPGDTANYIVNYKPTGDAGDNATLTILSNDPDEPEEVVALLGNGGGDFAYPNAEISCPSGSVTPPITVGLDGRRSSDPNGYDITRYEWTVAETPEGSGGFFRDPLADYANFFADISGEYLVQLVVENEIGLRSEPETCRIEAKPIENIHIEMFWDIPNSDLDLHFKQYGYELFELPGDCNYCNQNPNWGEPGEADDPELALDNRTGYGPENINLNNPGNGDYDVIVHYFNDAGGGQTAIATVKVWVDGSVAWEGSRLMEEDDIWEVGWIRWPDAVFTLTELDNYKATKKECWSPE